MYLGRDPQRAQWYQIIFFVNGMSPFLQATSLLSEFRNASQLLNPMSLLRFDAVEIRSSKEGKHKKMKEKLFHPIFVSGDLLNSNMEQGCK